MNNPIISVVVPVYNVERYLKECIDSILNQSFTSYEVILVDDGSIDKSGEICDKYAIDHQCITVFHVKNGGVSSARNIGIEKAQGQWITFVDSDDVIEPNFLMGLYTPIQRNSEIQFVHGGCKNLENNLVTGYNQIYSNYNGTDPLYLLKNFRGLTFSKLYNTDIIRQYNIRYDKKMRIAEDMAFTYDYMMRIRHYAFVEECGYLYRRDNNDSATHRRFNSNYQQELYNCNLLIDKYELYCKLNNIPVDYLIERFIQRGDSCFRAIMYLYIDKLPRKLRIQHLKNDWTGRNRMYLYNSVWWKKVLMRVLYKENYCLFDFLCVTFLSIYTKIYKR